MSFWEKVLVFGGLGTVLLWIVWGKVQQLMADRHPDARQMRELIDEIRYFLARQQDLERAEAENMRPANLPPELIAGIQKGQKILVLCEANEHPDLEVPQKKRCAIFLVRGDGGTLRLAVSGELERVARGARQLGRLLGLPVEMV